MVRGKVVFGVIGAALFIGMLGCLIYLIRLGITDGFGAFW